MSKEDVKTNVGEFNKVGSPRSPLRSLKAEDTQEETPRIGSKRQRAPDTVKEANTIKYDNNLVGSKVKVWSPSYERFYEGVIASFDYVKEHKDAEVEHPCHDTPSDAQRKKKKEGNKNSESSKSSKLKDTSTKSGVKSKDDGKSKSEIKVNNSEPSRNYADDAAIKSRDDLVILQKPSGGNMSKDDSVKTPSHVTKRDSQRSSSKSKGKTSQSGKPLTKTSSSPKVKESGKTLLKTTSSKKDGEGKFIWPTEGTLLPQATQSTLRCLSRMLNEGIHAGVTIITSDGSLKAHKSILSARSPVFHSMFQREKVSTVEMKEMTSESCMALLSFLYGSLNQEAFLKHRLDLLGAANEYEIVDLKDACEESLLEDINSGNVLKRLQKAWVYKLDKLKKGCFTYLVDSEKIYDVRVRELNEFFRRADRRLLEEMFQEVLVVWKRS